MSKKSVSKCIKDKLKTQINKKNIHSKQIVVTDKWNAFCQKELNFLFLFCEIVNKGLFYILYK